MADGNFDVVTGRLEKLKKAEQKKQWLEKTEREKTGLKN